MMVEHAVAFANRGLVSTVTVNQNSKILSLILSECFSTISAS